MSLSDIRARRLKGEAQCAECQRSREVVGRVSGCWTSTKGGSQAQRGGVRRGRGGERASWWVGCWGAWDQGGRTGLSTLDMDGAGHRGSGRQTSTKRGGGGARYGGRGRSGEVGGQGGGVDQVRWTWMEGDGGGELRHGGGRGQGSGRWERGRALASTEGGWTLGLGGSQLVGSLGGGEEVSGTARRWRRRRRGWGSCTRP